MWPFESHPSSDVRATINTERTRLIDQATRTNNAIQSHQTGLRSTNSTAITAHDASDEHRILLGQAAVSAIHHLLVTRRIVYAERAVTNGKTRLQNEVRASRSGNTTPGLAPRTRWESILNRLPRPSGRFGVPHVNLTMDERYGYLRAILMETRDIVARHGGAHELPVATRQTIVRKYLGILGADVDTAINDMDTLLPAAEEITTDMLVDYRVLLSDLLFQCRISIGELYDAQIVTTLDDLNRLHFNVGMIGDDSTTFSVDDFVSLFHGSYETLRQAFGLSLALLPERAFTANQLRLLRFSFDNEYESGTLEHIRRLHLTAAELREFGLTAQRLTNQFEMRDTSDLFRTLGWTRADLNDFMQSSPRNRSII